MFMDMNEITRNAEREYIRWSEQIREGDEYYEEYRALVDNPEELTDSFYCHLTFGTSGMRGLLGPGPNRINGIVIRRASAGLANYMNHRFRSPSAVISYDSRAGSAYYARETARVLNGSGIRTWIFRELTPVSCLSYAIRTLKCDMGVMITASHNPKIYNGYKVYNSEGYQIVGEEPESILNEIEKIDFFDAIPYNDDGVLTVDPEIGKDFVRSITALSTRIEPDRLNQLKTIYTPLNGAGRKYVRQVFQSIGYKNFEIVRTQEYPDENFPTCPQPNPEKILAFNEAFRRADIAGGDLLIATDPDSDRVGAALYHEGMRTLLTGNQLGVLLLDYLCHIRPPRPGQIVAKSIVTSPLGERIAERYGMKVVNTLTGFKYIGDLIRRLREEGRPKDFYFGFEESNGYLLSPFISEKDGVSSAMLIVEMAAFHKSYGKDPVDRLNELYEEYGICVDKIRNYYFQGVRGRIAMEKIMEYFRGEIGDSIGGRRILRKIDYMEDTGLPRADVVQFWLENGSTLAIRPSGTESKMKIYSFETEDFTSVEREIIRIIEKYR